MDTENIQELETTVEKAHADYVAHMKQFLMNARTQLTGQTTIECYDDILLHIDRVDFATMRSILHDIVQIFSKKTPDYTSQHRNMAIQKVHSNYIAHLSSEMQRKAHIATATEMKNTFATEATTKLDAQ